MHRTQSFIIALMLIVPALTSCSKGLSREEAAPLIRRSLALPEPEPKVVRIGRMPIGREFEWETVSSFLLNDDNGKQVKLLADEGFLSLKTGTTLTPWPFSREIPTCDVTVTEKGRPFLLSVTESSAKFRLGDIDLADVTGIALNDDKKTAKVIYDLRRTNITPIGLLFGVKEGDRFPDKTATLRLYDDGWRIE